MSKDIFWIYEPIVLDIFDGAPNRKHESINSSQLLPEEEQPKPSSIFERRIIAAPVIGEITLGLSGARILFWRCHHIQWGLVTSP
jgi:hypothetical protein